MYPVALTHYHPKQETLAKSADPDQTPQNAASDQGLHFVLHLIQDLLQNIVIINTNQTPASGLRLVFVCVEVALLTRCYTQQALRPYIDSEINHIRHFIKIPFINKGIEFIDLISIFRDNNVISAIPSYFENTESPIICYKYNKHIRNTILNFNKLVFDLDIETSFPDS